MRATLDASLCTPSNNPAGLNIDPTGLDVDLKGKPSLGLPPLEIELPKITVTLPTVKATLGPAGLGPPPGTVELDITFGPLVLDTGKMSVHGVPPGANVQPITLTLDLDQTIVSAAFNGLKAALQGCLLLNDGAPPPMPRPTITSASSMREGGLLIITGTGFGAVQGTGFVTIVDQGSQNHSPTAYTWTDTQIQATMTPVLTKGVYMVSVTNNAGVQSLPAPLTVT